jgi:hypothetical protein
MLYSSGVFIIAIDLTIIENPDFMMPRYTKTQDIGFLQYTAIPATVKHSS